MTLPLPAQPDQSAPRTAATWLRRLDRPLVGFFLGAFLLPWAVWGSRITQEHGWLGWHLPSGIALWTLLPVTLAAVSAAAGRGGLRDLGRRLIRWRAARGCYLAAVGLPLAIAGIAAGVGAAVDGSFHLGETLGLGAAAGYLLYGTGLFLLTEEAAWRGFALPRLMTRMSPMTASLVLGLIWATWHAPLFLLKSENDSAVPYSGFFLLTVATSVIIARLYVASHGSVLVCAIFHAVSDAAYSYVGVVGPHHAVFWTAVVLEVAVAGWLLWRNRRPSQ
jgi:membrane protease YdiL (CAAX protease family)